MTVSTTGAEEEGRQLATTTLPRLENVFLKYQKMMIRRD